jgi:hypothetical protein
MSGQDLWEVKAISWGCGGFGTAELQLWRSGRRNQLARVQASADLVPNGALSRLSDWRARSSAPLRITLDQLYGLEPLPDLDAPADARPTLDETA